MNAFVIDDFSLNLEDVERMILSIIFDLENGIGNYTKEEIKKYVDKLKSFDIENCIPENSDEERKKYAKILKYFEPKI